MSYRHLTQDERYQIDALFCLDLNCTQIAAQLDRHPSTIVRERRRNARAGSYQASAAQGLATERRRAASTRSHLSPAVLELLQAGLSQQWSPEQVCGRCDLLGLPVVSHTTIYRHVHRNGLRHQLRLPKRRRGYGSGRPQRFTDRKTIHQRPPEVDALTDLGHWELDTVHPAQVTMNERVSGMLRLGWSPSGCAIASRLMPLERQVHTLISNRGNEFAHAAFIEQMLNAWLYMADPHAPLQRGRNGHLNGLLRQYFPRSHDFSSISPEQLQRVEDLLNSRPRKRLQFLTPAEVFSNHQRVALQG